MLGLLHTNSFCITPVENGAALVYTNPKTDKANKNWQPASQLKSKWWSVLYNLVTVVLSAGQSDLWIFW